MLMTETVVPILTTSRLVDSASTMVGEEKKSKRVGFADDVSRVVAHIDLGEANEVWYSKLDLKLFKEKAKALSDHLHQTEPALVEEIEGAYSFTRTHKEVGADKLFRKWHKLSSSRRGLERFVLSKERRKEQAKEVKASRSVVLNLQCLFQRSPGAAQQKEQHAEMIRQQYTEFARPALALAQIYATKDAQAVKPYYVQTEEDDDDDDLEDLLLDDGILSIGSASVSSFSSSHTRDSLSAKKVKKTKKDSDSKDKKKANRRKSSKDSSSSPRGKSPLRRIKSMGNYAETAPRHY